MAENINYPEHMVFGLDIGTRSIVGSVGFMEKGKFNVVAHYTKEHETRAMLDGQIHDIQKVGESVNFVKKELEKQIGRTLNEVCIAAAGRMLRTVTVEVSTERTDDVPVTAEEIYSLDLLGVEKAYDIIRESEADIEFYCVGYSVVKYYMNGYTIQTLDGHRAKKIGAQVLATFLPHEVVEGLYSAVTIANLDVANLTLEPIAAINVAIPEQYRLLNIALVDVGAGTSDICITKDGSIVAYGMIPHAGDEITETIVHSCLVDFKTAEQIKKESVGRKQISYKDIMGLTAKKTPTEVRDIYKSAVNKITKEIAQKIKELNGGKSVSAVFIVGGGGKAFGFTDNLAKELNIQKERVALRGEEVLGDVVFHVDGVEKDPLLVTPIGICINFYDQKNNFIFITVNDQRIKLYDNDKLTVVDAVMQSYVNNSDIFPKRGDELVFTVNGQSRMIRGEMGDPAKITVNGYEANLTTKIGKNDKIVVVPSEKGEQATYTVEQLAEYKATLKFYINDKVTTCPKMAKVNGEMVTGSYKIKDGDVIEIPEYYLLSQLMQFMDIDITYHTVLINGHKAVEDEPIYHEFKLQIIDKTINHEEYLSDETIVNEEKQRDNNNNTAGVNGELSSALADAIGGDAKAFKTESQNNEPAVEMIVTVNGSPVLLKNKAHYLFVDILDFYPFDTSVAGGEELILTRNEERCEFSTPIESGDLLKIYWENVSVQN